MLLIDRQGLRSKEIDGVEIKDYREIARIFSTNPKYLDEDGKEKSIYLVPDNYIYDLQEASQHNKAKHSAASQEMPSIIDEVKHRSGRKGRKILAKDLKNLKGLYESMSKTGMNHDDISSYIESMTNDSELKEIYSKSSKLHKSCMNNTLIGVRELTFDRNEFDHIDKNGDVEEGEIVPLPITNFTKDKINDIRLGKTVFFINDSDTIGKENWRKVAIKGDYVDDLIETKTYSDREVYVSKHNNNNNNNNNSRVAVVAVVDPMNPIHEKYKPTGEEMVEITYVYGPNRSGKTYYAAKYATLWSEMFEKWPIYLFSRRDKDKVLDDIPSLSRVAINQDLVDNPLTMTDFEHSLVIFDDIDTIADKKICKAVQKLRDDIMETGRQKMIYVINTSHLGANYGPTRTVLNEANSYTIFPRKGNYEHNFRILKEKMGMKPEVIKSIMDRPNGIAHKGKWGWITIYKDSPQYIISEVGVKLL